VKLSNEFKVGVIAIVSIAVFIVGFNFLKGKKVFSKSMTLYAVYSDVKGLAPANQVIINGMQVGNVYELQTDKDMTRIVVTINITRDINIPKNSLALISPNPITGNTIEIRPGDSREYLKNKDTLMTDASAGLLEDLMKNVDPVLYEVKKAAGSLDTLMENINSLLSAGLKSDFSAAITNLNTLTAALAETASSLQAMMNSKTGTVTKTMNNLNSVTANLASNNGRVNSILGNLDSVSGKLAAADLENTLNKLDSAIGQLQLTLAKLNSGGGTAGKILNDPVLYDNLSSTSNKLNTLLDDFRTNPKRYLSFPLIGGKKKKEAPLSRPLPDTANAPYLNN
jgi:phospholipid/cholesterol/gamma-HCH transport system substrate-binding protein